jgi:hypothetical protein
VASPYAALQQLRSYSLGAHLKHALPDLFNGKGRTRQPRRKSSEMGVDSAAAQAAAHAVSGRTLATQCPSDWHASQPPIWNDSTIDLNCSGWLSTSSHRLVSLASPGTRFASGLGLVASLTEAEPALQSTRRLPNCASTAYGGAAHSIAAIKARLRAFMESTARCVTCVP